MKKIAENTEIPKGAVPPIEFRIIPMKSMILMSVVISPKK